VLSPGSGDRKRRHGGRWPLLIIAPSDMITMRVDIYPGEVAWPSTKIWHLDGRELYETRASRQYQHVGYGPTVVHATAANRWEPNSGVIRYATSGDVSGERDMVVGYRGWGVLNLADEEKQIPRRLKSVRR